MVQSLTITVALPSVEATALAQFLKRATLCSAHASRRPSGDAHLLERDGND